jgi:arthrofactin-type cyclic lipopeptide synthetase C
MSVINHLFNPLLPMAGINSNDLPLICVPGAGASVTSFIECINALGKRWPIYGLQPRGIEVGEHPHGSVEAAAICNLKAIERLTSLGPVHLLGHSYGASVAFEMAGRLREQNSPVASLTLIDGEPPAADYGAVCDITESQIHKEFVEAIELAHEKQLDIDSAVLASGETRYVILELHKALIRAGLLHQRSDAKTLQGPLATFTSARRNAYWPSTIYSGKTLLVLANAPSLDTVSSMKRHASSIEGWRCWASKLEVWHGPGNHFSILKNPHVQALAEKWKTWIG